MHILSVYTTPGTGLLDEEGNIKDIKKFKTVLYNK